MSVKLQKKQSLWFMIKRKHFGLRFFGKKSALQKSGSKVLPAPTHGDSLGSLTLDVLACQHVSQWPGNGGRMVDVFFKLSRGFCWSSPMYYRFTKCEE